MTTNHWDRQAYEARKLKEERLVQFGRVPVNDRCAIPEVIATVGEHHAGRIVEVLRQRDDFFYKITAIFTQQRLPNFPEIERE